MRGRPGVVGFRVGWGTVSRVSVCLDVQPDQPRLQGMFEEYMFFGLGPCDVVCESFHLDLLTPWDGGEVV